MLGETDLVLARGGQERCTSACEDDSGWTEKADECVWGEFHAVYRDAGMSMSALEMDNNEGLAEWD